MDLTSLPDIGPAYASILEQAGVGSVEDLAAVEDLQVLSEATKMEVFRLELFRASARQALAANGEASAQKDRVVLFDHIARARVVLHGVAHEDVDIVTAHLNEDAQDVLARAPGDAVLLKEKAVTAPVRVGGVMQGELPIYKQTGDPQTGELAEMRVRIAEIRDRNAPPARTLVPETPGEEEQAAGGKAAALKSRVMFWKKKPS